MISIRVLILCVAFSAGTRTQAAEKRRVLTEEQAAQLQKRCPATPVSVVQDCGGCNPLVEATINATTAVGVSADLDEALNDCGSGALKGKIYKWDLAEGSYYKCLSSKKEIGQTFKGLVGDAVKTSTDALMKEQGITALREWYKCRYSVDFPDERKPKSGEKFGGSQGVRQPSAPAIKHTLEPETSTFSGFRRAGDKAFQEGDYGEAITQYRHALPHVSKKKNAESWGNLMINLGRAHLEASKEAPGLEGREHLNGATLAFEQALAVFSKKEHREIWASIVDNQGLILVQRAKNASGHEVTLLLNSALRLFRDALDVRTWVDMPEEWALTTVHVGIVHQIDALRSAPPDDLRLLSEAERRYLDALSVLNKTDALESWAEAKLNLAYLHETQAQLESTSLAFHFLDEAKLIYGEVADATSPGGKSRIEWADARIGMAGVLVKQSGFLEAEKQMDLLPLAIKSCEEASAALTRKNARRWANAQNNLGDALSKLASFKSCPNELVARARKHYSEALFIYRKSDSPDQWASITNNVATLALNNSLSTDTELAEAANVFRELLDVYRFESAAKKWGTLQFNIGRAEFTRARRRLTGVAREQALRAAGSAFDEALRVRPKNSNETGPNEKWCRTQLGAAATRGLAGNQLDARSLLSQLERSCEYPDARIDLVDIYQNVLFDFGEAQRIAKKSYDLDSRNIEFQLTFSETLITTGRHLEAADILKGLLGRTEAGREFRIPTAVLAALASVDSPKVVRQQTEWLSQFIRGEATYCPTVWDVEGISYFVDREPRLTRHREWFARLLRSLKGDDGREQVLEVLNRLEIPPSN